MPSVPLVEVKPLKINKSLIKKIAGKYSVDTKANQQLKQIWEDGKGSTK